MHSALKARSISPYTELLFDGKRAYFTDKGVWSSTIYTINICLNCVGAMAKMPYIHYVEAAASERNPLAVLNSSTR